jgi:hypothetical protein
MYPAGSNSVVGTALGTGLTAPTGVAVDGAGDLYIGDSGHIVEIPFINDALAPKQQTTLLTGLGSHLNLATDGAGDVYVADMDNKQIVKISNPQIGLLLQGQGVNTIGAGVTFTGPSAIATDNLGNVWVADGTKLWELTPSGGSNEITSSLSAPVTGLAVDPSGSVFVAESTGLWWIPYEASSGGLNVNGAVQVAATLGSGSVPVSVALDGMENAYATYGSGSTAGMSQLGVGGTINFGQIVPFAESDQEAQLFNLGNAPLTLSAFSGDLFTGANAADYSVGTPNDAPACATATPLLAGTACYFDVALTPSAPGLSSASVAVLSNAANAPAVNIALSADAVVDPRNPSTTTVAVTPSSGINYPGSATVTVTVAATSGSTVPSGTVTLEVTGQKKASQALTNGVATFSFTGLLGGTYTAVADYGGESTAGSPPDFAASGGKTKFIVNTIPPALALGTPGCGPASATSCTLNPDFVTVWAGNTYIDVASQTTITATVTSTVGTPTGTVSFLQNGAPVDPTQPAIALDANGNAVFSTANLPVGVYNLTAVYNGDVNFSTVNFSLPAFQIIVPSVQITATPTTTSITPGTPDQVTLTLKPLVGFNQQVNVQCVTATMPNWSECTFDNPEIGVGNGTDPTAPSTIVVTISTNVPVNGGGTSSIARQAPWSMACLFGLGMLGLIAGRKRANRYLSMVCLAVMLSGAFIGITACTNSGYSTPPPAPKVTTPAGTYQVQIVTVNPQTGLQNSLTTPLFVLTTTVQ